MSDSDTIVITGSPPPYTPPFEAPNYYGMQTPSGGPPPPGAPNGPPPARLEGDATIFGGLRARPDMTVDLTDPKQKEWADQAAQVMKTLYFNVFFGEKGKIEGPRNHDVTESAFWEILKNSNIHLTTNEVGDTGAKATKYSDNSYSMTIDVDNPNIMAGVQQYGTEYINTVILHEFGHFLGDSVGYNTQDGATTYAQGISDYAYIGIMSPQQLEIQGWGVEPWF